MHKCKLTTLFHLNGLSWSAKARIQPQIHLKISSRLKARKGYHRDLAPFTNSLRGHKSPSCKLKLTEANKYNNQLRRWWPARLRLTLMRYHQVKLNRWLSMLTNTTKIKHSKKFNYNSTKRSSNLLSTNQSHRSYKLSSITISQWLLILLSPLRRNPTMLWTARSRR